MSDPRHGTVAGYNRIPCREFCCRSAYARWRRERNHDSNHGRQRVIDSTGSRRRIEALQALGWSIRSLAEQYGGDERAIWNVGRRPTINQAKAERIAALYDRLAMTTPPQETWDQRNSVARTLASARKKRYAVPLSWDEESIDDPAAKPYKKPRLIRDEIVDEVLIQRALDGHQVTANRLERRAIADRWRARGGSLKALNALQGWNAQRDIRKAS